MRGGMLNTLRELLRGAMIMVVVLMCGTNLTNAGERETAIQAAISTQLDAFRRNDSAAAWAIAAPNIQQRFGTPQRFVDMVSRSYPQIHNSKSVVFKDLREIEGELVQRVFVEGGPGDFVDAYYVMKRIDGHWRITGVYMAKPQPEST